MTLRIFISVDLPAPFSPSNTCTSDGMMSKLTPLSATVPAKRLTMFRTETNAPMMYPLNRAAADCPDHAVKRRPPWRLSEWLFLLGNQVRFDVDEFRAVVRLNRRFGLEGFNHDVQALCAHRGRVLGNGGRQFTMLDRVQSFGGTVGANHQNLALLIRIPDSLIHAQRHAVIGSVDRFQVRVALQDVGSHVQCAGPVPVRRLAGHQLNVVRGLEYACCAVATSIARCVAGLAFNNGDLATLRAQLINDELPAFGADGMVVRGQERDHATPGCLQLRQVHLLVQVDDVHALFVGGSDGLYEADRGNRRYRDGLVVFVDGVFHQTLLALDIVFTGSGEDIDLNALLLGLLLDAVAHCAPIRVAEGLQDHGVVGGTGLLHGAESKQ